MKILRMIEKNESLIDICLNYERMNYLDLIYAFSMG